MKPTTATKRVQKMVGKELVITSYTKEEGTKVLQRFVIVSAMADETRTIDKQPLIILHGKDADGNYVRQQASWDQADKLLHFDIVEQQGTQKYYKAFFV